MPEPYLPWLTFPPAVDLANTVRGAPSGDRDLLETEEQLTAWIAAERDRIPDVRAASGRLDDVRRLRSLVRGALYPRAHGKPVPDQVRLMLNSLSAAAPLHVSLAPGGRIVQRADSSDSYARFVATIARSAIALADREEERLSVCMAPSCGMLFLSEHQRQVWCTKECGNRARVARHAARRRRARRRGAVA
jgi:predicted RNA-binding Zn ribbon-like protein